MDSDNPMDPKENPVGTDHLPVAGESGVGRVPDPDPLTTDTNDDPDSAIDLDTPADQPQADDRRIDNIDKIGTKRTQPGPDSGQIGEDPTTGEPPV